MDLLPYGASPLVAPELVVAAEVVDQVVRGIERHAAGDIGGAAQGTVHARSPCGGGEQKDEACQEEATEDP